MHLRAEPSEQKVNYWLLAVVLYMTGCPTKAQHPITRQGHILKRNKLIHIYQITQMWVTAKTIQLIPYLHVLVVFFSMGNIQTQIAKESGH